MKTSAVRSDSFAAIRRRNLAQAGAQTGRAVTQPDQADLLGLSEAELTPAVQTALAALSIELEDLHPPLVLLGISGERLEVGWPVLLGRLLGGTFFLFLVLAGRRGLHAATWCAEAAAAHLGVGRSGEAEGGHTRHHQATPLRPPRAHAADSAQSSNSTPPVEAG